MEKGAMHLQDAELLAILLGSGIHGTPVQTLSLRVLKILAKKSFIPDIKDFLDIRGLGIAKATLLCAAIEFGRRISSPPHKKITIPYDVYRLLHQYVDKPQEHFFAIYLNGANEVISYQIITIGLLNQTLVHPREVFAQALQLRASCIIVAHNHPSGNLYPSEDDKEVTLRLEEAGKILGVTLLDHIIFATKGYFSFKHQGLLK